MNRAIRTTLLSGVCLLAVAASTSALAHGGRDYDRDRGHGRHHHHHKHWKEQRVVHERVIVRERPVVVERRVIHHYPAPQPVYYPRDPAIVVSVDIPPLVFPLR